MEVPDISFCLPVYNSSARIERCLGGVLAQAQAAREILVVDNASTDDTVAKARAVLENVPGARIVVNEKNLGRVENWNRCLELASGRYLKFALANDVLRPGGADMLLEAARATPDVTMVCSKECRVEAVPEVASLAPKNPEKNIFAPRETLQHLAKYNNDTGSLGGILINGEVVRKNKLRFREDIPFWSDFYFSIQLAALGSTVYVDAESYYFDTSVKGRFANTGTGAKSRSLCFEARECAKLLAELLPKYGVEPWRGFEFLHAIYVGTSWFGTQPTMLWRDTRALFAGAGPYRSSALRYRLGRSFDRPEFYAKRALAKLGLYHYPWETNAGNK